MKVVFDRSFSGAGFANCAYWFSGLSNLVEVAGFENMAGITTATQMFQGCSVLESIYATSFANGITSGSMMFYGCNRLVGGDAGVGAPAGGSPDGPSATPGAQPAMPRYRVATMQGGEKTWLPWMRGMVDEGGSSDTYAGIPGVGIADVEFDEATLGPQGWFEKNMRNGALIGLTVYYDTPDPASMGWWYCKYRTHWLGPSPAWGKWEHDDGDDGAGNGCDQVDMIELAIAPC